MYVRRIVLVMIMLSLTHPALAVSGIGGWRIPNVRMEMSTKAGALDGYDSNDFDAAGSTYDWVAASYHSADEWGSKSGFYMTDVRAPLAPGETKTWMLYIWGVPGGATGDFVASWSEVYPSDPLVHGRLELVQKPAGIIGGPALGIVWTTPPTSFTLPLYTTTDGLTGYGFRFTLTMVPEPSSILALAGGLAGLGRFVLRHWKRR